MEPIDIDKTKEILEPDKSSGGGGLHLSVKERLVFRQPERKSLLGLDVLANAMRAAAQLDGSFKVPKEKISSIRASMDDELENITSSQVEEDAANSSTSASTTRRYRDSSRIKTFDSESQITEERVGGTSSRHASKSSSYSQDITPSSRSPRSIHHRSSRYDSTEHDRRKSDYRDESKSQSRESRRYNTDRDNQGDESRSQSRESLRYGREYRDYGNKRSRYESSRRTPGRSDWDDGRWEWEDTPRRDSRSNSSRHYQPSPSPMLLGASPDARLVSPWLGVNTPQSAMDYSDSDSDGSHISSTPPLPPPPPPPHHSLSFLRKSPNPSCSSRPILKIKPSTKTKTKQPPPKSQPKIDGLPVSSIQSQSLPFQIRRPSGCSTSFDSTEEVLPAGGFCSSRFSSFSKLPFKFESSKNLEQTNIPDSDAVNGTLITCTDSGKVVMKKHPNLIGIPTAAQVSKPKPRAANEGNFVRLNINGHGGRKKLTNKVRKRNPNAYNGNPKSYKRSRRKLTNVAQGQEEEEDDDDCDQGLPTEPRPDLHVIEKAVFDVRHDPSDDNLIKLLKLTYGYDSFRDGQLEAIRLILSGKSSMVILPTGAGKSLCYQLPAMIFEGMSLVISPLVALMFDQLKHLPPAIPGGLLCSTQTPEESSETLRRVQQGTLKVLFVSPERLLNTEFTSIFTANSLISLVVIDEAHCISEWSHNFRPSYMRLRASLLRSSLGVGCILAMTATATTKTIHDVMHALEIPPTNLVQATQVRDNLQLSVSMSGNRRKDLMALLKAAPYTEVKSIIIYCKYQSETDMISKSLCESNIRAKSYHSGIPAKDRRRTQELFCSNKIRVIVATVAFGMGLDKSDVGAVIHYSLPESLEEYVQEIGRAGRDGGVSYCHLFFDDTTYFKLRSLMYSDGQDQYTVNKFLSQVFGGDSHSQGRICTIVKESASRKFDMKEEVILTVLTRLELAEEQYLRLLPQISVTCVLNFHMTSPALLAAKDTVIATILKKSEIKDGQHVFEIPTVAFSIGIQASTVTNHLQNLKLKGEITYELKDLAYCYMIVNFPKDVCSLAADLTKWLSDVESCKVRKVDAMYNAAVFAVKTCDRTNGCTGFQHTPCLQKKILDYFNADNDNNIPNKMVQNSRFLRADIKVFLQSNSHTKFTPRAIARIMHGIASPAFPFSTWCGTHFWGRYIQTNFDVIMEAAKAEMMVCAGKSTV